MTWTNLPATFGTDWHDRDFLNQFVLALNERLEGAKQIYEYTSLTIPLGHLPPLDEVQVGDDVQAASFIAGLQTRARVLAVMCVDPSSLWWTPGDGLPPQSEPSGGDYFQSNTSPWAYYAFSDLMVAAGVAAGDWTRKYPREISSDAAPGNDGEVARHSSSGDIYEHDGTSWALAVDQLEPPDVIADAGVCEPGDYIGHSPWIWNELQLAIQRIDLFGAAIGEFSVGAGGGLAVFTASTKTTVLKLGQTDTPPTGLDEAGARAEAEADWPNSTNNGGVDPNVSKYPGAWTDQGGPLGNKTAQMRRQIDTYSFPPDGGMDRYLDVYAQVVVNEPLQPTQQIYPRVFDAKGSGYALGNWELIRHGVFADGATVTAGDVPNADEPPWDPIRTGYVLKTWALMYFDWEYA